MKDVNELQEKYGNRNKFCVDQDEDVRMYEHKKWVKRMRSEVFKTSDRISYEFDSISGFP